MEGINLNTEVYTEESNSSLYYPVIKIGENKKDWLLFEDLSRHCLVLGATGSGKTSGWGKKYLSSVMAAGCGGLVLTVKKDEAEFVKNIAKKEGRVDDVMEFTLDGKYCFNFLDYTLKKAVASGSRTYVNQVLNLFKNVVAMHAGSSDATDSKDAFWINAMEELLGYVIRVLIYAGEEVSVDNMYNFVATLPEDKDSWDKVNNEKAFAVNDGKNFDPDKIKDLNYFFKSYCKAELSIAETESNPSKTSVDLDKLTDWKRTNIYFTERLGQFDIKTKATFVQMFSGMANQLLEGGIREAFSTGKTNISPEMTFEGKIIILNIPYLEEGENARICQVIFKYCWQKEVEKRMVNQESPFVFLYCDEAQYFVTRNDPQFLSTCRSNKACVCYMTQNVNGLARYLGFNKMNLQSFLGNFQLNVFHQNGDYETNDYAVKLVGKTLKQKISKTKSDQKTSDTIHEVWEDELQISSFTTFVCGGKNNRTPDGIPVVEALLFLCGRTWSNGHNYHKYYMSQV